MEGTSVADPTSYIKFLQSKKKNCDWWKLWRKPLICDYLLKILVMYLAIFLLYLVIFVVYLAKPFFSLSKF